MKKYEKMSKKKENEKHEKISTPLKLILFLFKIFHECIL